MGYGVTFVGGVVGFGDILHKELNLPEESVVVVGLSVGKATRHNDHKPKINKVFMNKYDKEETIASLEGYNEVLSSYYKQRGSDSDYIQATRGQQESEPFAAG
ncbi:CR(VI) reductase-like, partial [Haliotis asinina]|uniref:CR(VI) reductase-like n=1 Tax=Haliotis asinina TaxID=109174 RepID=UPI003531BAF8